MECAHERVAQSVEHVTFNHGVVGSIPTALTSKIKDLYRCTQNINPYFDYVLKM